MFSDFVLVLSELLEMDSDAQIVFEAGDGGFGFNVYTSNHNKFDPKNLSRDALTVMVVHGWEYEKDDEFSNYFFFED